MKKLCLIFILFALSLSGYCAQELVYRDVSVTSGTLTADISGLIRSQAPVMINNMRIKSDTISGTLKVSIYTDNDILYWESGSVSSNTLSALITNTDSYPPIVVSPAWKFKITQTNKQTKKTHTLYIGYER